MTAVEVVLYIILLVKSASCHIPSSSSSSSSGSSFLWRVESAPPSYFFGTIHVPYTRVWDSVPSNVKSAFGSSRHVFFELDLTDSKTIRSLSSCQLLPPGHHLSQYIPSGLYARLKLHMDYVRLSMASWITADQKAKGYDANYLFTAVTANWERKKPIWVTLLVISLTKSDVASRGLPVLDLYLALEAEKLGKNVAAIETVAEQCGPLNSLNNTQVLFALNHTLIQQENLRFGIQNEGHYFSTDDLIQHYRQGNLDKVIFNQENIMFPSLTSNNNKENCLTEREKNLAKSIDEFFKKEIIAERNKRMASRVVNLLVQHPSTPFFFAFGAAHFIGEQTVLDFVQAAGFTIKHIAPNDTLPELPSHWKSSGGRNTVQGTFDDLSEEEKTRAYLQFLQYHQQLEQESETKKFQEMLKTGQSMTKEEDEEIKESQDEKSVEESLRLWYGLSSCDHNRTNFSFLILVTFTISCLMAS